MGPRILMPEGLAPGQPFRPDRCRGRAVVASEKEGEVDGQRMSLGFVRETLGARESASKKNVSGGSPHRRAKHWTRSEGESGSVRLAPVAGERVETYGRRAHKKKTMAGRRPVKCRRPRMRSVEAATSDDRKGSPVSVRNRAVARLKPRQVRTAQDRTPWAGLAGRRCSEQMHRGDDEWWSGRRSKQASCRRGDVRRATAESTAAGLFSLGSLMDDDGPMGGLVVEERRLGGGRIARCAGGA